MRRLLARSAVLILSLVVGLATSACGGDEHKDHKNHTTSGGSK